MRHPPSPLSRRRAGAASRDNGHWTNGRCALPEAKLAKAAGEHAAVVAHNIGALIRGSTDLTTYRPSPPAISFPLGPSGGASYAPGRGVLGAEATSRLKGADLKVGPYETLFGLA
ncbi:hypothetical protein [Streptomyces winkii]|uniref:hypothetical protein n=1 Tax=Streptomyces winkii TaxID=3051178 RepID=UPI0028D839D9|nr:hypothetical protein [Streptomyces sp. DSM 40971]